MLDGAFGENGSVFNLVTLSGLDGALVFLSTYVQSVLALWRLAQFLNPALGCTGGIIP